jgi:hypothetical protein
LLTPVTVTIPEPDEQKVTVAMLPPLGVWTIFTVPVIAVSLHVMPDATSCGVTVTVYVPGEEPDTTMLDDVDEPVRPDGNDQAYWVAPVTPVTATVPVPVAEQ